MFKGAATGTIHVSPCGDGPHGSICLNTCYPVGRDVCEGLGGTALLEEVSSGVLSVSIYVNI